MSRRTRRSSSRGGEAPTPRFDRRLIAPMVLGSVLNPVNSSIIAVSLVPIGAALGAPPAETAWLVSALYLATAIGQPVVGRLVDTYGTRRLYLAGAALVGVGGVLGTLAPSLPILVVARVVLGLGTCAGYPAAMSLVRSEARRTGVDRPQGVLTLLAVSSQTIAVLGPPLGGLLIGLGGWRATFAVNVPFALACLVLGWLFLPRRTPAGPRGTTDAAPPGRLDAPGMVLFSGMLVALLFFLMELDQDRWWLLALSAGSAVALCGWELRAADPFLDLRLLGADKPLLATYGRAFLAQCTAYLYFFGFTQWLQDGRGLTAPHAGLLLVPMFGTAIAVSAVSGGSPGVRGKLVVGAVAQAVVAGLLLALTSGSAVWLLVVLSLMAGLPLGLIGLANQNAVYSQADPARTASSAGLLRTFSYLGAIVASATIGLSYPQHADTAGLHHLAFVMLGLAALLLALTVADRSLRRVGHDQDPFPRARRPRRQ